MFIYRIKKESPLQILNKETGEVIEISCPKDFKNTGIRVALKLPENYKILHTKQRVDNDDIKDDSFNK